MVEAQSIAMMRIDYVKLAFNAYITSSSMHAPHPLLTSAAALEGMFKITIISACPVRPDPDILFMASSGLRVPCYSREA
jgi:hypothetical protein